MDILGIAAQGLDQAQTQFEKAAARIAQSATPESPSDMVSLLSAKNDFEASLATARVADDMTKATLDLLA